MNDDVKVKVDDRLAKKTLIKTLVYLAFVEAVISKDLCGQTFAATLAHAYLQTFDEYLDRQLGQHPLITQLDLETLCFDTNSMKYHRSWSYMSLQIVSMISGNNNSVQMQYVGGRH